jgi:hypothetical protein
MYVYYSSIEMLLIRDRKRLVHAICSVPPDDPNAGFGEYHKCFQCPEIQAANHQPPAVPLLLRC